MYNEGSLYYVSIFPIPVNIMASNLSNPRVVNGVGPDGVPSQDTLETNQSPLILQFVLLGRPYREGQVTDGIGTLTPRDRGHTQTLHHTLCTHLSHHEIVCELIMLYVQGTSKSHQPLYSTIYLHPSFPLTTIYPPINTMFPGMERDIWPLSLSRLLAYNPPYPLIFFSLS